MDDNAGCVRGKCRCIADYFLMDGDCGEKIMFFFHNRHDISWRYENTNRCLRDSRI